MLSVKSAGVDSGLDDVHSGEDILLRVNASGDVFLSHTKLDDGVALRVAIGNLGTVETDVARCRELLSEGIECLSSR